MHRLAASALAALLIAIVPAPLTAQADTNSHRRLVNALADPVRLMAGVDQKIDAEQRLQFEQDAEAQAMEAECPGGYALMVETVRPFVHEIQARAIEEYRASLFELFTERLDPTDARGAAEFYESDIGQTILDAVEENWVETRMMSEIRSDEAVVSQESFEADKQDTSRAIVERLEPALLREVSERLLASPWFADIRAIEPDIKRLQLAMVNTDFTADESKRFGTALEEALTPHYEACYSSEE